MWAMSQAVQPEDTRPEADTVRVIGTVKWFDATKGYGFIVPGGVTVSPFGGDVLLHITILRQYGENLADEGANIVCDAVRSEKGWQAVNIIEMDPPRMGRGPDNDPDSYSTVIVKWFNRTKGYGFVQELDSNEDIFIHAVVAREGGVETLEPGDELNVSIQSGAKGRYVGALKTDG